MVRLRSALCVTVAFALVTIASVTAGLSHSTEDGDAVEWHFLSPLAQPLDEGLQITCVTDVDLRDDPIAVDDMVGEHVRFSCVSATGTYCDYPSWTPEPLQDPDFCGDASEFAPCQGVLYNFSGTLRIVPASEDTFEVTYDGLYDGGEGGC